MSPCAYLAGLLHPLIIEELRLPERGFHWTPASNGLFVPFEDGSSVQLFDDDEQCEAELRRFAPGDVQGWREMSGLIARVRDAIRPPDENDLWIGEPPTREQLQDRLHTIPRPADCFLSGQWLSLSSDISAKNVCRWLTWDRVLLAQRPALSKGYGIYSFPSCIG